jgi:glycosyltransferase involved in cell wall biosynthesis
MKVQLVIPVFNEELLLEENVGLLYEFLQQHVSFEYEVVIADNASTDRTLAIANSLIPRHPFLRVVHLNLKGRGRALKKTWGESRADILCYMDADLSTGLQALPELIEALASDKYDLATGSRLIQPQMTSRSIKREIISRTYNFLVRRLLHTRFSDAQCGFKAITRSAARDLLPLVEDPEWFFDTELLVLAEKMGYQVFDLPVPWTENRERPSRVNIISTIVGDIRGLVHLRRRVSCLTGAARNRRRCEIVKGKV